MFQQQGVDLGLLHGVAAGALAHGDALGVAAGEFQHAGADQMVVQDHIGALDGADGGQGQKLGVAGAGADEVDHAGTGVGLVGGGAAEQAVHFGAGFFRAAVHGEIAGAAVQHFVPVAQALAGGGQGVLDFAAEFPGQMARRPKAAGIADSSRWRIRRASAGASPPVETATMTGERSRIAGKMKSQRSGLSTTFSGMPRILVRVASERVKASSSVASTTRATPSRSAGVKSDAAT